MSEKNIHTAKIESIFIYRNRLCMTKRHHIAYPSEVIEMCPYLLDSNDWTCGYVSIDEDQENLDYDQYQYSTEESTFAGTFGEGGICFLGFDTNHSYDTHQTRTKEITIKRLKNYIDGLLEWKEDD